ncbi:NAD(P)/FAD-dependent oxidoreductase [Achromobacter xylosoxidans]|uniref:FAD/NAD(P)-binding oxidoreductase n=1 Tax=Alcaligenes xylosoxydans xylosoxydans TaxID=85698 RepID=A0A424W410_ALCXX|nr:FAD/NAD(P)-binding oxidoreductase [Achromobacter xylosoxidans]MBC9908630.1 FAD-dependent oxidoreductase [Achromobacter xylosoxidans]MBD0872691.1 FAD-dependent oxidoreductase [Achromobacter xylosoxidans]QNP87690.1 FAD-dependent oxidoreductase [Achromobacter xylosoxidans]RPJ88026.1 FAD/NAD(P)-binding oxidoreductase [Achromobacter xylosoxidans]
MQVNPPGADGAPRMVVVGAGPAGVRAAQTLLRHGVRPVIVDEAALPGGQIYRQGAAPRGSARQRYGFEWKRAQAIHAAGADLAARADYRAATAVWNAAPGSLDLVRHGELETLPYSRLLLATGATDRVLPFPGWTLPGVYTLGGAQISLKSQGCTFGPRIVFAGTGPLLYLVAYQYARAGAQVQAVLDCAPPGSQVRAAPALLSQPGMLAKGMYYLGWLRARGVPVHHGARLDAAEGAGRVERTLATLGGKQRAIACDALAIGHGLRAETQLADLLDCAFEFDTAQRAWLPRRDPEGRSSEAGVYLAGDGAGIGGAILAELAGERAALAMLADSGIDVSAARVQWLARRQARWAQFRRGLDRAFPLPGADGACDDSVMVCRCEEVRAGTLRAAAAQYAIDDLNRLKALTRIGMGLCQGRMCQAGAAELLADCRGLALADIGRLRGQAPVKPLNLSMLGKVEP